MSQYGVRHLRYPALIDLKIEGGKTIQGVTCFFPAEGIVSKVPKPDGRIGVDAEACLSGGLLEIGHCGCF